jgi:TatD DNase family protein
VENFIPAFCGNMTYKRVDNIREAFLEAWRVRRFFFETDSPYLTPVPMRGRRNEPAYVAFIYEFGAKLVGKDTDVLAHITHRWWDYLWG